MARHKEFDTEETLERALDLFWRQGYAATSLSQLQEAMGIGRQSLYDTFGDKHRLFLAALEQYIREYFHTPLRDLEHPDAGLEELRRYLVHTIEFNASMPARRSCLVANSAMELGLLDPDVADVVRGCVARMSSAFRSVLTAAKRRGEISSSARPAVLAHVLVNCVLGLSVSARAGMAKSDLLDTINVTMQSLNS